MRETDFDGLYSLEYSDGLGYSIAAAERSTGKLAAARKSAFQALFLPILDVHLVDTRLSFYEPEQELIGYRPPRTVFDSPLCVPGTLINNDNFHLFEQFPYSPCNAAARAFGDASLIACTNSDLAVDALLEATSSVEAARVAAGEKVGGLEFAGAGYSGYHGPEKEALYSLQASLDNSENYNEAFTQLTYFNDMLELCDTNYADPLAYANSMNALVGRGENALTESASIYCEASASIDSMQEAYSSRYSLVDSERARLRGQLEQMSEEGYSLISAFELEPLSSYSSGSFYAQSIALAPSEKMNSIRLLLDDFNGSGKNLAASQSLAASYQQNYLALALVELDDASEKHALAESSLQEIREDTQHYAGLYFQMVSEELDSVEELAASFSPSTRPEKNALELAERELANASNLVAGAALLPAPLRVLNLYRAHSHLEKAGLLLSPESLQEASLLEQARDSLASLEQAITLAEKDGLDCGLERSLLEDYESVLTSVDSQRLRLIIDSTASLEQGVFEKASAAFSDLPARRLALFSKLSYLSAHSAVAAKLSQYSSLKNSFAEIESSYVRAGVFSPRECLGNYKEIQSAYSQIEQAFESSSSQILKAVLEQNARASHSITVAVAGSCSNCSLLVETENDSPFSTLSPIGFSVPLSFSPDSASLVEGTSSIKSAEISDSTISLGLASALSGSVHKAGLNCSLVSSSSPVFSEEQLFLSEKELVASSEASFESFHALGSLQVAFQLPAGASVVSATSSNGFVSAVNQFGEDNAVLLSGAREGKCSVKLTYSLPSPYSVRVTGFESVEKTNSTNESVVFVRVKSNAMALEQAPISFFFNSTGLIPGTLRVSLKGEPIEFEKEEFAGITWLYWTVPSLDAGKPLDYWVRFDSTNPQPVLEEQGLGEPAPTIAQTPFPTVFPTPTPLFSERDFAEEEGPGQEGLEQEFESAMSSFKETASRAGTALSFSVNSSVKRSASGLVNDSFLEEAERLAGLEFNPANHLQAVSELEAFVASAGSFLSSLQSSALASFEEANLAVNQFEELAPGSQEYAEELASLDSELAEAGQALAEGRLADSLALSRHVSKRVQSLLSITPPVKEVSEEKEDGFSLGDPILFGLPALLLLLAGAYKLKKKPKKKPGLRSLPKAL